VSSHDSKQATVTVAVEMSSSQPFLASSPLSGGTIVGARRKSKFTYKHLVQLSQYNASCPLRVIALVDLDAFYAV
jgi:DNA polymerase eta